MATTYKETFWDCPECHEPNISGVFNPYGRRCPNCLYHRRDSDLLEVRDISKVITDVELQQAAHSPDLVCGNPACKAEFADEGLALHLIQCPRCESWMNDWVEKKAVDSEFGEAIAQTQASPATRMENIAKVYGAAPPPTRKGRRAIARKLAIGGAAAAGLLGVSIGGLMLFASTPVAFTVEGKYYEMTTTVETYLPRSAADWEENVPTVAYQPGDEISADQPTAYEVDSKRVERKVRSTQDVPVSRFGVGRGVATILPVHASAKTYLLADCTVGGNGVAICEDVQPVVEDAADSPEEAPLIPDAPDTDYQTEDVWDIWVDYTEWSWQRDRQETVEGAGDVPSEIATLRLSPMQRSTNRSPICYVEGTYHLADALDEAAETDIFEIDCDESRQLNIGETAALMMRDRYVWIESE